MKSGAGNKNHLYYGDNLPILRRYIDDDSVDLIYIDPPFNSNASYNILFREQNGARSAGQMKAFTDTWRWDQGASATYDELMAHGGKIAQAIRAFRQLLGTSDMLAYLVMMAPRLIEMHRVLKPTGSFYLHCDPAVSHYLKIILDALFGAAYFQNEITWKRTSAHSSAKRYGPIHDIILFYTKSDEFTWNAQYQPYDPGYIKSHYSQFGEDGRQYTASDLTASGTRNGSSGQPWRGFDPAIKGNHWKFAIETLDRLDGEGRIHWPVSGGWPRYKRYGDC